MKRMLICFLLACVMTAGASAAYVPDNELCENRNGRQLIVKTFTLSPADDPESLIDDPFEREGCGYAFISMVKEERPFEYKKTHSETATIETASKDLSVVLGALEATLPYDDGEYSGTLALDHTSLHTEAAGYSAKSYTLSETKTIGGLDRNDPGFIPKTTVKNGVTLTLQNIEWSVQGTALAGDSLVPSQYMATATYSAGVSGKVATGYVTTAAYTGEVRSSGIESIVYTVTYLGEPLPAPDVKTMPDVRYFIYAGAALLLLAAGTGAYLLLRKNTRIYTLIDGSGEYALIGKLRLGARSMSIDLFGFKKQPGTEAVVEINGRTARRLFGKLIRIRLRDGTVTHRIEQNGSDDYWFTVSTLTQEEETE